jgi:hypothetical protein
MYETSYCPLKNTEIDETECYDIQMVRSHMIKESVLDFRLNRNEADRLCTKCSFNQLECKNPTSVLINVPQNVEK